MPVYNHQKVRSTTRIQKPGAIPQNSGLRRDAPVSAPVMPFPTRSDAMDVDVHKLVSDAIKQTEASKQAIPFPATPTLGQGFIDADQSRTRKRSRTTALLSSPTHKRSRTPSEATCADTPPSLIPVPTHHAKRQRTTSVQPLSDATSSINAPPSPPQVQTTDKHRGDRSRLPSVAAAPTAPASPPPAPQVPPPSPPHTPRPRVDIRTSPPRTGFSLLRRKRPTAGEIQSLIFLYRSIVYGLMYLHTRPNSTFNIYALPEPSPTAPADPTRFGHLYDNLVARRIRAYLLYLGVDRNILEIDVDAIKAEVLEYGNQYRADRMAGEGIDFDLLDDPSFAHPKLHCFTNCSVLSYPQLVAMLTMRHRAKAQQQRSSSSAKSSSRRRKGPSSLRNSF